MVYLGVVWTCRHIPPVLSNHQFQLALFLSHQTAKIIDFSLVLFFKFINLLFFLSQSGGTKKKVSNQTASEQRRQANVQVSNEAFKAWGATSLHATRALKRDSCASVGFLWSNN